MHSMTAYAKGVSKRDGKTITIEIKTVNHRFLDCNFKLPRNFLFVEDKVKKAVSSAMPVVASGACVSKVTAAEVSKPVSSGND